MAKETQTSIAATYSVTSTFGMHEAARILIPGFYFSLLLFCYYRAFLIDVARLAFSPLGFVAVFIGTTLVAGLTIYAKETPKRRRAFLENQPSQYLSAKARTMKDMPLLDDAEAQRLYFYLLNNHIPALFHEKIFFFGTVYSIMIQVRRTSFWFGVVGVVSLIAELSMAFVLAEHQALVVFTLVVWIIYFLNIRYNKADRKMQENYRDQIFWMEMNDQLVETILRKRQNPPLRP